MRIIDRRVIVNYIASVLNMLAVFLLTPLYLKYLGRSAFGIISFGVTIQSVLFLFDFGVPKLLRRELAVLDRPVKYKLAVLNTNEILYFIVLPLLFIVSFVFSKFLGNFFLVSSDYSESNIQIVWNLIVGTSLLQMLYSIYNGAFWGLGETIKANILQIFFILARNFLPIFFITYLNAGLIEFLFYQLVISALFIFIMRLVLEKNIRQKLSITSFFVSKKVIIENRFFSGGLIILSLLAFANYHIDKILVSKELGAEIYGAYYSSFTLSQLPVIVSGPLIAVYFPRLTELYTSSIEKFSELLLLVSRYMIIIISIIFSSLLLFHKELMMLWTKDAVIAEIGNTILPYLIVAGSLQALSLITFNLTLLKKQSIAYAKIGILILLLYIPLVFFLVRNYSIIGAAQGWLCYNLLSFPVYAYFVFSGRFKTLLFRIIKEFFQIILVIVPIHLVFTQIIERFLPYKDSILFIVFLTSTSAIISILIIILINKFKLNQKT